MNEKDPYRDLFSLQGKTAIVTGGLGILGKRFCAGLATFGAQVGVIDLDESAAAAYADELSKRYGVKAVGVGCNVADPVSVAAMVEQVVAALGGIHILHNNAATKSTDLDAFFAPFEDYALQEWRKIMAVNIDGMFLVAQAVGKQMIKQGVGGSIIQTASHYGINGPDKRIYEGSFYLNRQINTPAVYTVSKAAVVGLTKYLATYWADQNIRVNTLTPGGVESGQNDEFKRRYSAKVPLGRMANGDELVGALVFMASDASSYMTGHNMIVDGGWSAW